MGKIIDYLANMSCFDFVITVIGFVSSVLGIIAFFYNKNNSQNNKNNSQKAVINKSPGAKISQKIGSDNNHGHNRKN